jgi:hypothetical protein
LVGNKEQQKKYLGRLVDEPLVTVSMVVSSVTLPIIIKLLTLQWEIVAAAISLLNF